MSNPTLRRADVLKLIDMTARPFDAMIMRGQAPWPHRDSGRQWGEFTTEDAYRVALVHALIRQGRSYEQAGSAVRSVFAELLDIETEAHGDLLLGSFITESAADEEAAVRMHLSLVAAESDWFAELQRQRLVMGPGDHLLAFSAVNATAVMRRTLAKADAAGLRDDRLVQLAKKVRAL